MEQGRLLELIAAELWSFRGEFKSEVARLETRLTRIDECLDRLVEMLGGVQMQMSARVSRLESTR